MNTNGQSEADILVCRSQKLDNGQQREADTLVCHPQVLNIEQADEAMNGQMDEQMNGQTFMSAILRNWTTGLSVRQTFLSAILKR